MTFLEVREGIYWLPSVPVNFRYWIERGYEPAEHVLVHRRCWKRLKEKHRRRIRKEAWPGQEPRSMDGWV